MALSVSPENSLGRHGRGTEFGNTRRDSRRFSDRVNAASRSVARVAAMVLWIKGYSPQIA